VASLPAVFVELKATTTQFMSSFDQAKKVVNDFSSQSTTGLQKLEQIGKVAFVGLAGAATAFGGLAVKAALDGQAAHAQLVQAVQNSGTAFESVGGRVDAMSGQFAKLGFENDAVEAAMTRLVTATGDTKAAMDNMGLAADLARARHISLEDASSALGKVLAGNMRGMTAFGLSTKDAGGNTLTTADAIAELNQRFGGAGQAAANTYAGKLQAMNAEWHNMTESIGNMLLPVLADAAGAVAGVVGWFEKHRDAAIALGAVISGPLVIAMSAYIAKQAIAFAGSTIEMVKRVAGAIVSFLIPATEGEAAALTTAATAEAFFTAGLSVAAGIAAVVAMKAAMHASATNDVATSATGAAGAIDDLGGAETGLGTVTDNTTNSLKEQADAFAKLNGNSSAQGDLVLKLIGDQNSLDGANQRLKDSTGANSEATKQATQHTRDLAAANKDVKDAADAVTDALDKQTTAKKKLDDLMKPQTTKNIVSAQDAFQAAQDNVAKTSENLTDKQKALSDAIAKYGPNSKEAESAQWDYNAALRDAHTATNDLDTASQDLANTYRPTVGTVDDIKDATKEYGDATKVVTDAQGKQKDAQGKLNDVLADKDAITAAKTDTKNLADNTLAWQRATSDLNDDWAKLQDLISQHPELRDQLVSQVTQMKNNLPKGSDSKPLIDILTMLNQPIPPKSLAAAFFDSVPADSGAALLGMLVAPPGVTNPALIGGGLLGILGSAGPAAPKSAPTPAYQLPAFGVPIPPRASGGPVRAGMSYIVGENGPEPFIPSTSGTILPNSTLGGVSIGQVTITIPGYGGDVQALASAVRDELILLGKRNGPVGLS
jgi:hypothetical protein